MTISVKTYTSEDCGNKVRLTWNDVPSATKYKISYSTSLNGSYTEDPSDITATTSTVSVPTPDFTYYFVVKAYSGTNLIGTSAPKSAMSSSNCSLTGYCTGSPSSPSLNTNVVWSVTPTGGTPSYNYKWSDNSSGSPFTDTGSTNSTTTSYSTAGLKSMYYKITDSTSPTSINTGWQACSNQVNVGGSAPVIDSFESDPLTINSGGRCKVIWKLGTYDSNTICQIKLGTAPKYNVPTPVSSTDYWLSEQIYYETTYSFTCWEKDPITNLEISGTKTNPKYATCKINGVSAETNGGN